MIPPRYAKDGENLSPPLEWSGVPDGTVELALVCDDPDAPHGTFTHWALTGIDPSIRDIPAGEAPPGAIDLRNDFGDDGYDGPQPPVGDDPHRYVFRLYALDAPLALRPDIDLDLDAVREELDEHRLATGTLVGLYAR